MPVLLDTDVSIEILRGSRYAIESVATNDGDVYMENHCTLATGNAKHFSKVDGLSLVNWCRET